MKFLALAVVPTAFAAISPRAGAPARPDVDALNKAINDANRVAGTCVTAVNAFHTQGITDTTSLETSCVPLDPSFAAIDTILVGTTSLERPDDLKDLKGIEQTLTALLKTFGIIESSINGKGTAALKTASCKLFAKNSDSGATTIKVLQKLALSLSKGGVLPELSVSADNFAKKIIEGTKTMKSTCGTASPSTTSTTGITLPPPVTRSQDGTTGPTGAAGSGSGGAAGSGGSGAAPVPSSIVTAGVATLAPGLVAVLAIAGVAIVI